MRLQRSTRRSTSAGPRHRRSALGLVGAVALISAGLGLVAPAASAAPASSTDQAAALDAAAADASTGLKPPASALTEVKKFGYNPTNLAMHLYVPKKVSKHPAVVVAIHYCTGSGPAMFSGTQYASLADRYGFVVVYPSATREGHCFDVASPAALTHNGTSDPAGIVSMVQYVEKHQNVDSRKVFATGISSGAMMTNVLLGDYPDVFTAGSAMSGVAFGCFATTDPSGWNDPCAKGTVNKSPKEWGDIVRAAYPSYRGPRPAMQLIHGTADAVLYYPNFTEEVKEWTNVLKTGSTPARVTYPKPTWTRSTYVDKDGRLAVDAISVANGSHNVAFDEPGLDAQAIAFFGLTAHSAR